MSNKQGVSHYSFRLPSPQPSSSAYLLGNSNPNNYISPLREQSSQIWHDQQNVSRFKSSVSKTNISNLREDSITDQKEAIKQSLYITIGSGEKKLFLDSSDKKAKIVRSKTDNYGNRFKLQRSPEPLRHKMTNQRPKLVRRVEVQSLDVPSKTQNHMWRTSDKEQRRHFRLKESDKWKSKLNKHPKKQNVHKEFFLYKKSNKTGRTDLQAKETVNSMFDNSVQSRNVNSSKFLTSDGKSNIFQSPLNDSLHHNNRGAQVENWAAHGRHKTFNLSRNPFSLSGVSQSNNLMNGLKSMKDNDSYSVNRDQLKVRVRGFSKETGAKKIRDSTSSYCSMQNWPGSLPSQTHVKDGDPWRNEPCKMNERKVSRQRNPTDEQDHQLEQLLSKRTLDKTSRKSSEIFLNQRSMLGGPTNSPNNFHIPLNHSKQCNNVFPVGTNTLSINQLGSTSNDGRVNIYNISNKFYNDSQLNILMDSRSHVSRNHAASTGDCFTYRTQSKQMSSNLETYANIPLQKPRSRIFNDLNMSSGHPSFEHSRGNSYNQSIAQPKPQKTKGMRQKCFTTCRQGFNENSLTELLTGMRPKNAFMKGQEDRANFNRGSFTNSDLVNKNRSDILISKQDYRYNRSKENLTEHKSNPMNMVPLRNTRYISNGEFFKTLTKNPANNRKKNFSQLEKPNKGKSLRRILKNIGNTINLTSLKHNLDQKMFRSYKKEAKENKGLLKNIKGGFQYLNIQNLTVLISILMGSDYIDYSPLLCLKMLYTFIEAINICK